MSRKEDEYLIALMGTLLAEIAIIVNGLPPDNISWSYHDLPEKVRALKQAPPAAVPDACGYPEGDPDTGADNGPCCLYAYADGWNECRAAMLAAANRESRK